MSYMDLEDFMEVLDDNKQKSSLNNDVQRPNYDALLQSLTSLGKIMDKGDNQTSKTALPKPNANQDLTADLFSTMSDSEMLSHFMPVRGIDYDQFCYEDDDPVKKSKGEVTEPRLQADEFMPYKLMPQMNPLYKLTSAFKPVTNNNATVNVTEPVILNEEETPDTDKSDEKPDISIAVIKKASTKIYARSQGEKNHVEDHDLDELPVRQIKKRKPRTYKYNPKPLQHKICRAFVPDELKDREYWERRKRNNEAAKKSREERRKKELEIMNSYEMMKNEYSQIKIENIRLKARNAVLEKQVADLQRKIKE